MKKNHIIILAILFGSIGTFYPFFSSSDANPSSSNLLITEILYDTPGCDTTCEWIELYNPTGASISINGWTIMDNVGSNILPAVNIPAGGYYVISRSSTGFQSLYGFLPDFDLLTLALGNSGDRVSLVDSFNTEVDFVAWENYVTGWSVSAIDQSIRRIMDIGVNPVDTDDPSDWEDSGSLGNPGSGYGGSGDTTSPLVIITNPSNGIVVQNTVAIDCSATDDSGLISSYRILIDSTERSTTNSYFWDTTVESSGIHSIRCEATDPSSNLGFDEITITVDNSPISDQVKVFFNDPLLGLPYMDNFNAMKGNLSDNLIFEINSATSSIYAAWYDIGYQGVVDAVINAFVTRGIDVRIAAEDDNIAEFQLLIDAGIPVTSVSSSNLMHNKFVIFDMQKVWTGSYNPTDTGTFFNANDAVLLKSAEVATIFRAEFDQLFANIKGSAKNPNGGSATIGPTTIEVLFSPKDNPETRLISLINSATSSIHLSLFYLTDNPTYDALKAANDRGVQIHAVFDYRGYRNFYSEMDDIIELVGGINAVIDANPGVYHHKFMVIDGSIVWVGSINFSASGYNSNDENAVIIHNSDIASHFVSRTEDYRLDANNYDSDSTQAPRIVTRHYDSWAGAVSVSWRPRMDGNVPKPVVDKYVLYRYNTSINEWQELLDTHWGYNYAPDFDVISGSTYYYCVASITNGVQSECSAEFGQVYVDGLGDSQLVFYPASGHLTSFGSDTTVPNVIITHPANAATISGFVDITFEALDASHIKIYEIYVDDILQASSSLFNLDTTKFSDGSHTIRTKAFDAQNNFAEDTISVFIDNSAYIKPPEPALDTLKILELNIGASGDNGDYAKILEEENADIAVLIETGSLDDKGNKSANELIVRLNNYFENSEQPYHIAVAQGQNMKYTGTVILSRFTILNEEDIIFEALDSGVKYDFNHDVQRVEVSIGSNSVHIFGIHLKASGGATNQEKRAKQTEALMNWIDNNLASTDHIILAGDFNSESSHVFDQNNCLIGTLGGCDLGYAPFDIITNSNGSDPRTSAIHSFSDTWRDIYPTSNVGHTYISTDYGSSRIDFIYANNLFLSGQTVSGTTGDAPSSSETDHLGVDILFDLSSWDSAPVRVTGLIAIDVSDTQIDLSWNANTESDLDHYNIYRNGTFLISVMGTSYSDMSLTPITTYNYEVSAVDSGSNEGLKSSVATATTQSSGSGIGYILISEIFYDVPGVDNIGEWIELYNPTSSVVDLTGWTLSDNKNSWTIPAGIVIEAFSYLIIARNSIGFNQLYGFNPDVSGLTLALGNSGDQVSLKNSLGIEVDFVAWENFVSGWNITALTGQSIARLSLIVDNDVVVDWIVLGSNGTPGT